MTSLRNMLSNDSASGGVFFPVDSDGNPKGFNETIYLYPRGQRGRRQSLNAVVDEDRLEGTRESFGDGVQLDRQPGRSIRESIVVVVPASVVITPERGGKEQDLLKIRGEMWGVKRLLSQDAHVQEYLCVRRKDLDVRFPTRSG